MNQIKLTCIVSHSWVNLCTPQWYIIDFSLLNANRFLQSYLKSSTLQGLQTRRICILTVARKLQICSKFLLPVSLSQLCNETRLNMKSSWGCFDRTIFCWNGFCWQKSKHLKQLAWFVRIWVWKESEEIKFAKHQCHSIFRIPIFCVDFFFWYTKGSHTASDVISCLPSCDNLWRQWGRPQPQLQMWLGACCTFKPLISLPERAQWKPKVGCFLGICSMTILVFFFQREKPHKTFQLCNHHQDMPHLVFWDLIEMPSMLLQRPCTPESAQMDVAFGLVFQRIFFTSLPFS